VVVVVVGELVVVVLGAGEVVVVVFGSAVSSVGPDWVSLLL
jgi:hypothetical protein